MRSTSSAWKPGRGRTFHCRPQLDSAAITENHKASSQDRLRRIAALMISRPSAFRPVTARAFTYHNVQILKAFSVRRALADEAHRRYGLWRVGLVPGIMDRLYLLTLGRRVRHARVQLIVDQCRSLPNRQSPAR